MKESSTFTPKERGRATDQNYTRNFQIFGT